MKKIITCVAMLLLVTMNLFADATIPTFAGGVTVVNIPEDAIAGDLVATVEASPATAGKIVDYKLDGNNNNFEVSSTGDVTIKPGFIPLFDGQTLNIKVSARENLDADGMDDWITSGGTLKIKVILGAGPPVVRPTVTNISLQGSSNSVNGDVVDTLTATGGTGFSYEQWTKDKTKDANGNLNRNNFNISLAGEITVQNAAMTVGAVYNYMVRVFNAETGSTTETIQITVVGPVVKPTFSSANTYTEDSDAVNGDVLGTLLALSDTPVTTYTLVPGLDSAAVTIANGNELQVLDELMFDSTITLTFNVTATDDDGDVSLPYLITINVTFIQPVFTLADVNANILENSPTGFVVTNPLATVNGVGAVTYTMPVHSVFEIVGNVIQVKDGSLLDYETTPQYVMTITATDSNTVPQQTTATVTVNITNVNEITTFFDTNRSVFETVADGSNVGSPMQFTAEGTNFSFAFFTPTAVYSIDNAGQITVPNSGLLVGGMKTFEVLITDTDSLEWARASVSIEVLMPVDLIQNQNPVYTVDENVSNFIFPVTAHSSSTLTTTDPNISFIGHDATYSGSLDYESSSIYIFDVTASDGFNPSDTATMTIHVNNMNDNGTISFATNPELRNVDENSTGGSMILGGNIVATATYPGNVTYEILAVNDYAVFSINANTGGISVFGVQDIDFETDNFYTIDVRATDNLSGQTATTTVDIDVNDILELSQPMVNNQTFEIAEKQFLDGVGTGLFVNASGENLVYTQTNSTFSINAATGELMILDNVPVTDTATFILPVTVTNSVTGEMATADITLDIVPEGTFYVEDRPQKSHHRHGKCLVNSSSTKHWSVLFLLTISFLVLLMPSKTRRCR